MPVDGLAAAQAMLGFGRIRPGYCLYYVWQAYKAVGASTGRSAGTALEAWRESDGKHPGDWNPPPGVPVWFGAKPSSNAGDVVISLGGGRVRVTEPPGRNNVVGDCTIAERAAQIGRPYLGWTERIFDQPISYPAPAGVEETDDMPYTEQQLENIVKRAISDSDVGGVVARQTVPLPTELPDSVEPDGSPKRRRIMDLIRYLPWFHRSIILEVRALNTENLTKLDDTQLEVYADAVAAEQARRHATVGS